jgi:APA family basic amino acid/polyamine antiporter
MKPLSASRLARSVGAGQFFTLSFAAIVGVGWIVVLGDWLRQGGPVGAITGFVLAAVVMILVGMCYAELGAILPVSGGEIAYVYEAFGLRTSFLAGWALSLAYIATTSFEAISASWIAGILFPALRTFSLYTVRGVPVRAGDIAFGWAGIGFLTYLNYRSMKSSVRFQDIMTYLKVVIAGVFIGTALLWGKVSNLYPLFSTAVDISYRGILTVFSTATFWLSGFSIVAQLMEEKKKDTSYRRVAMMLLLSITTASVFYCALILSCSMILPWRSLLELEMPAAAEFTVRFNSSLWTKIILFTGLLGVFATLNSFLIASSRTIFALGRSKMIHPSFANIHPVFASPTTAVLFVGIVSAGGVLLGGGGIAPIVNMVSGCLVLVYFLVTLGLVPIRKSYADRRRLYLPGGHFIPVAAALTSLFMLFESFYLPYLNNTNRMPLEWLLFLGWALTGILLWKLAGKVRGTVSDALRRRLILGEEYCFLPSSDVSLVVPPASHVR